MIRKKRCEHQVVFTTLSTYQPVMVSMFCYSPFIGIRFHRKYSVRRLRMMSFNIVIVKVCVEKY